MKDMTFQIEKMTTTRQKIYEKDNTLKPRIAMLNLCDVILEVLATMQTEHEWEGKRESPPDREIRNPLNVEDRRNEVKAMLNVCANELENKVLYPQDGAREMMVGGHYHSCSELLHLIVKQIKTYE